MPTWGFVPHLRVRRRKLSVSPASKDVGFGNGFSMALLVVVCCFRRYGGFVAASRPNLAHVDIYSNLLFFDRT